VVLARDAEGALTQSVITLPESVKPKRYRQEFRTRFCEGLLARRILIAEGAADAAGFPVTCRRLAELRPDIYSSLEALGICTIDAGGETNIPDMARLYRDLGKQTFAICDKQSPDHKTLIEAEVDFALMHEEKGFENLVLKNTTEAALIRFANLIDWPPHLLAKYPDPTSVARTALDEYFGWTKGNWGVADFLAQCDETEVPQWLREACTTLMAACAPAPADADKAESASAQNSAAADAAE
jgi:putative ATP-dependent endonuclease of the OLD family